MPSWDVWGNAAPVFGSHSEMTLFNFGRVPVFDLSSYARKRSEPGSVTRHSVALSGQFLPLRGRQRGPVKLRSKQRPGSPAIDFCFLFPPCSSGAFEVVNPNYRPPRYYVFGCYQPLNITIQPERLNRLAWPLNERTAYISLSF